jgi:hypothetical protein
MNNYTIDDHIHRYSIWTAARASQRGLKNLTIKKVKNIIENVNLKQRIEVYRNSESEINNKTFTIFHKEVANDIIKQGEILKINLTYGRASKIISIYLKTAIVIPEKGKDIFSNTLHAPIDSILLKALSKEFKKLNWKKLTWTKFKEDEYWKLIEELIHNGLPINWKLENYWNPED